MPSCLFVGEDIPCYWYISYPRFCIIIHIFFFAGVDDTMECAVTYRVVYDELPPSFFVDPPPSIMDVLLLGFMSQTLPQAQ